ncbi:ethylbenzene dehydrogenase-related protein [Vibrio neptunius]|uniref:ethylbenzene dehydrogenase-related protein n=1 Tax=Vibrio neptunius TaxID=170651 RepID=UPI001F08A110|nr:ethylbenzene dehydrogenase-related protein [Vibrio neptunius]
MKRTLVWVVLHGFAMLFVLINLFTGFRIATVSYPHWLFFSVWLPQGQLHSIHIYSGIALSALTLSYCTYRWRLKPSVKSSPHRGINAFNKRFIKVSYVLFPTLIVTGWLLLGGYAGDASKLHFYLAHGALLYLFLHAGGYFVQYGVTVFVSLFSTQVTGPEIRQILVVLTLTCVPWMGLFLTSSSTLTATTLPPDQVISIDGIADEHIWKNTPSTYVETHGGEGFENGYTRIGIKALHNQQDIFFHITWDDPTESLNHLPLVKTDKGWQVQEDGFYRFDEKRFYEDKLAIMLSNTCNLGADGTAHLGPKPLEGKPANWHGKGYHYSPDNSLRDLWHWKAVRTNAMYQADDNSFTTPQQVDPAKRRYTAGYITDGKESGAYVMNWQWYSPHGVTPKRLPNSNLTSSFSSINQSTRYAPYLSWHDTMAYTQHVDQSPLKTILPSVLHNSNQFEGDRGDVRAFGRWNNGVWSLEIARRLETGSVQDIAIRDGVCLWVAAFDHSQIAHTRHAQGIRLAFEAAQ